MLAKLFNKETKNYALLFIVLSLFIFNVYYSNKGVISYNKGGNASSLHFSLPFTIVIIIVPSFILLYLLQILRNRTNLAKNNSVYLFSLFEQLGMLGLILIALISQVISSWMSFESFFNMIFSNKIQNIILNAKKSDLESELKIKEILQSQEKSINFELENINQKIRENNERLKYAKDRHLKLDFTFKTIKQDLLKEVEKYEKENEVLIQKQEKYFKKLKDLNIEIANITKTKGTYEISNNIKGVDVLINRSSIIDSSDYPNRVFVYLLFFLSICLDAFLAISFCMLQNFYNQIVENKDNTLSYTNKTTITESKVKVLENGISLVSTKESLQFIKSNLENDGKTIKSTRTILKETNISDYKLRKYLSELMDLGLLYKRKKRFVLNTNVPNI